MKKLNLLYLLVWFFLTLWMAMDVNAHAVHSCSDGYSNAQIPVDRISYSLHSGMHGASANQEKPLQVYQALIQEPDARWLRLHFDDHNLGRRSYLTITSLLDGERQVFNASSLKDWHNSSAYFNGDAVEIELYVASGDENIFFQIDKITLGSRSSSTEKRSIQTEVLDEHWDCSNDDRVSSNDFAVGRVVSISGEPPDTTMLCTGFIASNGILISAGHCYEGWRDFDIIQFNVPKSESNGNINHPSVEDQYPIDKSSIIWDHTSPDNDWLLSEVLPNSNTKLLPVQAYGEFYRLRQGSSAETFRVTGYGFDAGEDRYSQQTATGSKGGVVGNEVYYDTYIDLGNSGGPIIEASTNLGVGIVTLLDCPNGGNSFLHQALSDSLNEFLATDIKFVDNGHILANGSGDGSLFEPFPDIEDALNNITSGGMLSIVAGEYPGSLTIDKAVTIVAPVGKVKIGGSGSPKIVHDDENEFKKNAPEKFRLSNNYPNPFNPITIISYELPDKVKVKLEIFDILGRSIALLVNEQQPPGIYNVEWNASAMASGVYIYRLRAGNFVQTRSMMLLK